MYIKVISSDAKYEAYADEETAQKRYNHLKQLCDEGYTRILKIEMISKNGEIIDEYQRLE